MIRGLFHEQAHKAVISTKRCHGSKSQLGRVLGWFRLVTMRPVAGDGALYEDAEEASSCAIG